MNQQINEEQVNRFAKAWFQALDNHLPIKECYAFLASEGLTMKFPEGDLHNLTDFKKWYDRVTNLFFDESHFLQEVVSQINGESAEVNISVGWQASFWEPPDARSKRLVLDATQIWTVRNSRKNEFGLEIVTYIAQAQPFRYAPGFAHL